MLSITSQKLPIPLAREIIDIDLAQAHTHKEKKPAIADYYYERVDVALHKLAEHEGIKQPSFYERKHYFRSARTPETAEQKALQQSIADVHFERGEVLSRLNSLDKARAQYRKADEWGHPSAQEALKVLGQLPSRPSSLFGSPAGLHKISSFNSGGSVLSAAPSLTSMPTSHIDEAPAFKFFLKNLPLHPPALPQAGQSLRNTEQLAYCLLLLSLKKEEAASASKLSAEELAWLARVKRDQEASELGLLAQDVIRAFEKDELKNASAVAEVVALAPVYARDDFQKLLNKFITKLNELALLDFDVLHGLAEMIRHAPADSLRTDDLVKILSNLADRLKNTHAQSGDNQYRLAIAICQVLDAMADNQVTDLNREALHQPLKDLFNGLKSSSDPYLVYQAEYACQALAYVPDDETPWQGAWRRVSGVVSGVSKFASAVKAFDLNGFVDGVKNLQAPMMELIEVAKETYEKVTALQESGQALIESLKEGFSFNRKHVWYPMLRGFDEVPSDQLNDFKQKLMQPELKACRWHLTFLWGLSERLARIAAHPEQKTDTRKQALQWLGELYEDDQMWSQSPIIKQRVVQLIRTLADDSPVKKDADEWIDRFKTVGNAAQQTFYEDCLNAPLNPFPLYEARPQSISLSLLDKVQNKQSLEPVLRQLKAQCLERWQNTLYVPPQGKASLAASDTETFDLADKAEAFFNSDKKVALVLGESGAGKSTFLRFLEVTLWKKYQKGGLIPLFIPLPTIDNPEQDFITKHLRRLGLGKAQIQTLKEHRQFVIIGDGYDESGVDDNLYESNKLNHPGEWRGQLIVGCRSQHLGGHYRPRFQPANPAQYEEWVVTSFGPTQVNQYIDAHVELKQQHREGAHDAFDLLHWEVQDYQRALTHIDDSFKRTPLLLKTALGVLPRLLNLERQDAALLTRATLYDESMKARFEREKQRLQGKELTDDLKSAFNDLDREGFVKHCMQFVTQLAVAIYEKNQGNPVVEYDPFTDEAVWKDAFFGRDRYQSILREAWPLIRHGNQYRFEHKSFLEYFATRDICEPQETESKARTHVAPPHQLALAARRGSNASLLSFESQYTLPEVSEIEDIPLPDSLLTRRNLIKEPAIIQFLAERVKTEPNFKQQLHAFIERSKTDSTVRKAAANAITILVRAGVPFNGADLKGIQIPGADLSDGVFDSADLQGADLRKVNLRKSWLRQANLSGAKMEGARFGEWPYLQEESDVNACAYSRDGKACAVGLRNGTISVYDTSSWEKICTLQGHTASVNSVVYSPSGDQIASGSDDNTIRLWDAHSGEAGHILQGHIRGVSSVVYSPNGQQIVSGSWDNTVRLWDAHSGEAGPILQGHTNSVLSVVYSPSGQQIASGSLDKTVRLWDAHSGEVGHILRGHTDRVLSVVYSPSGQQIASASRDYTVRLWDAYSGEAGHILEGHTDWVSSVVYSPSSQQIASGSVDKTVRLWDAHSGEVGSILQGHTDWVSSVVYSPSGQQIASGSGDKTVRLWDAHSGETGPTLQGHTAYVSGVVYSPSGQQIASGSKDETVRLWDAHSGEASHILEGHTASVRSLVYSPSGDQIASGSSDTTVRLWDAYSGEAGPILEGHTGSVWSLVYSPSGDQIASGSSDTTVRLWDAHSGEAGHILQGHIDRVLSVVYSPSGTQLASSSEDNTVRLWDAHSGDAGHVLEGHTAPVSSVVYLPSGQQIASGSDDNTVRLWDAQSGEAGHTLEGHTGSVWSVMYSPSGQQIASGSRDHTVRLWDAHSGALEYTLQGHTDVVWSVVYSPSGNQIASVSLDKTVRLWDTTSGQCLTVVRDFQGSINSLAWKEIANRTYLVTGCADKSVRVWQVIEEGGRYQVRLSWSTTHETLILTDTAIQGVQGLSQVNKKLLQQRGAVGEPASRLGETSQRAMSVAAAVSKFKAPLNRKTVDTLPSAQSHSAAISSANPMPLANDQHLFSHLV